ncbi:hypothetical protein OC834_005900 [Tilletia horrida]|nr:hypothetical protein OC834_005900 [Tilletia horrida]KAK0530838.1 hypothetical protein OC835_003880 [Tilletia horrida]KAK0558340.1 hypothetical protein OC844_005233 [Tilletia horrida]
MDAATSSVSTASPATGLTADLSQLPPPPGALHQSSTSSTAVSLPLPENVPDAVARSPPKVDIQGADVEWNDDGLVLRSDGKVTYFRVSENDAWRPVTTMEAGSKYNPVILDDRDS